jgi:hypothetical protein
MGSSQLEFEREYLEVPRIENRTGDIVTKLVRRSPRNISQSRHPPRVIWPSTITLMCWFLDARGGGRISAKEEIIFCQSISEIDVALQSKGGPCPTKTESRKGFVMKSLGVELK